MNYIYITLSLSALCTLVTFLGYMRLTRLDAMKQGSLKQNVSNIESSTCRIETQLLKITDVINLMNERLIKIETTLENNGKRVG